MAIHPKLIYRFNEIPIKIPAKFFFFFSEIDKLSPNLYGSARDSESQNKAEGLILFYFKIYNKRASVIKTDTVVRTDIQVSGSELRTPQNLYGQFIFSKDAKKFNGEQIIFSIKVLGQSDTHLKRIKLNLYLKP